MIVCDGTAGAAAWKEKSLRSLMNAEADNCALDSSAGVKGQNPHFNRRHAIESFCTTLQSEATRNRDNAVLCKILKKCKMTSSKCGGRAAPVVRTSPRNSSSQRRRRRRAASQRRRRSSAVRARLLRNGVSCRSQGFTFRRMSSPTQCLAAAQRNSRCRAKTIMWSQRYNRWWGCRCCSRSGWGRRNRNWAVYGK